MTIIISEKNHIHDLLKENLIECISVKEAVRKDIRPLRIGILNIMPKAESYEFNLLHALGRSIIQIEPYWIRLKSHKYKSSDYTHLSNVYQYFDDINKETKLDALIVSGAPIEKYDFKDVTYWDELKEIVNYAKKHYSSVLGICWGGLALAKILGFDKESYNKKIFGVFESRNLNTKHPITGKMDDLFFCPQSRFSGIRDSVLEQAQSEKKINLLAHSVQAGYFIFESTDSKFLIHLGHPEYDTKRLITEYKRDYDRGLTNVPYPKNFDINFPLNRWRGHRNEFFTQWVKYVFDNTDLSD